MKILHVNNQASVGYIISRAQRELGHTSDLLAVKKQIQRRPDHEASDVKDIFVKLLKMASRYDLIHVHGGIGVSGMGLLPFKALKKRFFSHYHGSELREGIQTSFHFICDRLFISTPDLFRYSKNVGDRTLIHIPNPVEVDGIQTVDWDKSLKSLSGDGPLKIAHMPTRREIKGTENVIRGVEEANSKGANIVLDIIEGVYVEEAMTRLENAHICIDWMSPDYDIHGVVSIEAMVRGIPTICNIDRTMYPEDIPIIDSKPQELGKRLLKVWDKRSDLPKIGARSRAYVKSVHHPLSAAKKIEEYI